jgi:hypothetical protein
MNGSANGFAKETTFIENVALQGSPFASQVGNAAPDSSEAIHTREAAAWCYMSQSSGREGLQTQVSDNDYTDKWNIDLCRDRHRKVVTYRN